MYFEVAQPCLVADDRSIELVPSTGDRPSGIVGAIENGRRLTADQLQDALARGQQWEADRLRAGEPLPRPSR